MSFKTKTILKSFFETGDKPTQSQFADLIDSMTPSTIRVPKHSSVTAGDVGKLIIAENGVAKVSKLIDFPSPVNGVLELEVTQIPEIPVGNLVSVQLLGQPVAGDTVRILYQNFMFVATATNTKQIAIGATLADTLTNITSVLNIEGSYSQHYFSVTNDGVDTLLFDFSNPLSPWFSSITNTYIFNPSASKEEFIDFSIQPGVVDTEVDQGNGLNWKNNAQQYFFNLFGNNFTFDMISDCCSLTPGDYVLSCGKRWPVNETIFADAIETALNSYSFDILFTYVRTGNAFVITYIGTFNGSDWQFSDSYLIEKGGQCVFQHNNTPIFDSAGIKTLSPNPIGVLIGVDGTDAIVDTGNIFTAKIGGSVVGESVYFFSESGEMESLESFLSYNGSNQQYDEINRELFGLIPLFKKLSIGGAVGDTAIFYKISTTLITFFR